MIARKIAAQLRKRSTFTIQYLVYRTIALGIVEIQDSQNG